MATIKAEYYRLNGATWDKYYFKTTADMVENIGTIGQTVVNPQGSLNIDDKELKGGNYSLSGPVGSWPFANPYGVLINLPYRQGTGNRYGSQIAMGDDYTAMAIRSQTAGGWNQWKKVILEGDTYTQSESDERYRRNYLPNSGANWDTFYQQGQYMIAGEYAGVAPAPGIIYGTLDVTVSTGGTYNGVNNWVWQTFMDTSMPPVKYTRNRINNSDWSEWRVIADRTWVTSNTRSSTWVPNWSNITGKPSGILRQVDYKDGMMIVEVL